MNMIPLTGLWLSETKDGEKYFSGTLGTGAKVLIFKNKFKKEDSHPDYQLYIGQNKKQDQSNTNSDSTSEQYEDYESMAF